MFNHLVGHEPEVEPLEGIAGFKPVGKVPPEELVAAQVATSDWLAELGAPDDEEITQEQEQLAAREAFAVLTTPQPPETQTTALLSLKSPAAVQRLEQMLTAYDWEFVEKAKELRSYAVGKILEETKHVDARIRLRALELLGKVTEVGLFTARVQVVKPETSGDELDTKLRERLERYLKATGQLQDVTTVEVVNAEELKNVEVGDD